MKSNIFKYLFIIFAIGILIFAIYKIRKDEEINNQVQFEQSETNQEKVYEINLGIAEFDNINPILSNNKNVQDISKLIFEPLVDLSSDYKAKPCLANEWAKQADNSYVIKLRDDVRWSNGTSFTAEDVRYTIDRLKDTTSIYSYNVQYVTGVDVIDNTTLKIHLDREVPFLEYNLTFPIMSKTYYEDTDFATTPKNNMPLGTGKYKIDSVNDTSIILAKNNNWWDANNTNLSLEKITINKYASIGELYNAFKIGNIDLVSTTNNSLEEYIGTIGYNNKEVSGREHDFLAFNMQNPILQNIEVRKAISYSIDKANIVSSIFNNKYATSDFPLDYGTWIYSQKSASSGYNLEQAKQVLVDNGWSYKNNTWQKYQNYKTTRINLNLLVKASDQTRLLVAQNIATQLGNQGIKVNVIQASDSQYNAALSNKNFDIALCSMYTSPSPSMTTFFGQNNLSGYATDETNEIMNEVKNTNDDQVLKDKYKMLSDIYINDVPYISLYTNKYRVAYSLSLSGELTPNWFNVFYNVETWSK